MNWRDVLYLITVDYIKNDMGDLIEVTDERLVYCNKQSIKQSEFYQAQATGLRPELQFEIRSMEYGGEKLIRFNELEYNVIRTYDKGEQIELVCQGVVQNGIS